MNINWDARKYASNFSFVPEYGKRVVDLITSPKGMPIM